MSVYVFVTGVNVSEGVYGEQRPLSAITVTAVEVVCGAVLIRFALLCVRLTLSENNSKFDFDSVAVFELCLFVFVVGAHLVQTNTVAFTRTLTYYNNNSNSSSNNSSNSSNNSNSNSCNE